MFDTVKNPATANSMQIAGVQMFSSTDGTGTGILGTTDAIIAIDLDPLTYAANETPANAINGTNAKYLHFGKEGSGFITTPSAGPSILESFTITTANDAFQRDPASYSIYGTNDAITSADGSDGSAENWILIQSGALALTDVRNAVQSPVAIVGNTTAYSSYRVVFDSIKASGATNSMQIAEIQFEGQLVPEPSSALLGLFALLPLVFRRRRA